jgi:RNA polymerase sigma factor (sigma-70 family)
VEASAINASGIAGLHGRSPLLRLQSDERLIALVRRGNHSAFEVLVGRYQTRLLAFCRHMLGSREDAEDVLQEVFAAAFNAILADDRPINVRPWLYRIARNRSLNHLRRIQPIGVDSMDIHLSEHGITTADKVDRKEALRELVADVQQLPETQRTALLLREIDALSYEQIAEAMETTVPSVKSLLVRARVSLAEAAEARKLSCDEVRFELGEIAEGLRHRTTPPVRRHLRACDRCAAFRTQLKTTNKGLALLLPAAPLLLVKKLLLAHLGLSASAGSAGGTATGTAAVGAAAIAPAAGSAGGGLVSAGIGAVATKAAASIAAAALVTAGAVEIEHTAPHRARPHPAAIAQAPTRPLSRAIPVPAPIVVRPTRKAAAIPAKPAHSDATAAKAKQGPNPAKTTTTATPPPTTTTAVTTTPVPGQTQLESSTTNLPSTLPSNPPPQPTTLADAPPPSTTTTPTTTPAPAPTSTPTTPAPPPPTTTTTTTPPPPPSSTTTTPTAPPSPTTDPATSASLDLDEAGTAAATGTTPTP